MSDTHPLHPSHTGRNECDAARVRPSVAHGCSNCQSSLMTPKPTFCCKQCDFVLCPTCANSNSHPAHVQHQLYPFNISHETGRWRYDACKRSNMDLGETQRYYCPICYFNLCKNCFVPVSRPLHRHPLIRTDVRDVYHASRGEWCCDVCRNNNGPGNYYPWHCKTYQFDICDNCCKPWKSYHHQHPLFKADSNLVYGHFNGEWHCDICSISFAPQFNNKPYHCGLCKFDLCEECLRKSSDPSNKGHKKELEVGDLSPSVYNELRDKLNEEMKGKDYVALADKMNYTNDQLRAFKKRSPSNPANEILQDWRTKDGHNVRKLIWILREIKRDDLAKMLEEQDYKDAADKEY